MNIRFEKLTNKYLELVFNWLKEPHMQEFWDNSQKHKDDIVNFIHGYPNPPGYGVRFIYWIGFIDEQPFSFILTSEMDATQADIAPLHRAHLSKTGNTITLDFGIGDPAFIGKKLASPTLLAFVEFYTTLDPKADTFFIDPDDNNPRAKHVYEKAGFQQVGDFHVSEGTFQGSISHLMVKRVK